jgi:putative peptidoglycan lipid II flippase
MFPADQRRAAKAGSDVVAGVRTIGRLTVINAINTLLAFLNTVIVAYYFGTGRPAEVYLAAAGLYASLMSLAQTGQVSEILLPTYHQLRARLGAEVAFGAYTALVNRLLMALGLLCASAWLFSPILAGWRVPGFELTEIAMVSEMFRWILPLVLLQLAAELFKTLANAERLFGSPEIISGTARVVSLASLMLLAGRVGPWSLVAALWCAVVVEICGNLWLLRRHGYRYSLRLRLPTSASEVRLFGKLAGTLPYVLLTQVYLFVLDAGLSRLAQGSFAVFRYASMIWSRSQGVFLRPVSSTFFTEFSESNARATGRGQGLTDQALSRVLAVSALVATAVLAGAGPILGSLWEGERFSTEQIRSLVWLLGGFYVLLPVMGTAVILRKVAVSVGRVSEVYMGLAVVQLFSAVLAWQIVPLTGLAGALLVSSFNLVGFCMVPLLLLRMTKRTLEVRYPFGRAWRWLVSAAVGVIAAWVIQRGIAEGTAGLAGRIRDFTAGSVLATIGLAVAFGVSWGLGVSESRILASKIRRVIGS